MSSTDTVVFVVFYGGLVTLAVGTAALVVSLLWMLVASLARAVHRLMLNT